MNRLIILFFLLITTDIFSQKIEKITDNAIGQVYSFYIDPSSNFFASGEVPGITYSSDKGESWYKVNNNLKNRSIFKYYFDGSYFCIDNDGRLFRADSFKNDFSELKLLPEDTIALSITSANGSLFIGTNDGSLLKSTNSGDDWTILINGDGGSSITSILVENGQIIVTGFGKGVLKSNDNGVSWTELNNGLSEFNFQLLKHFTGGYILLDENAGLFRSSDMSNWQKIIGDSGCSGFSGVVRLTSGELFCTTIDCGIKKSTDFGNTWVKISGNISDFFYDIISDNQDRIFVCDGFTNSYRSDDKGETWVKLTNRNKPKISIENIEIDNSGTIYASSYNSLYSSRDKGNNWDSLKLPKSVVDNGYFSFRIIDDFTLLIIMDTPYMTQNNGQSWQTVPPFVTFFDADRDGKGNVIALSYPNLYIKQKNNNYFEIFKALDSQILFTGLKVNTDNEIYIGGENLCLYKLKPGDTSAKCLLSRDLNENRDISKILFNSKKEVFLLDILGGIWYSKDDFKTKSRISDNIPGTGKVTALAISGSDILFTGTDNDKMYSSSDNGTNWELFASEIFLTKTTDVLLADSIKINVLATDRYGNIFIGKDNGLYISKMYSFVDVTERTLNPIISPNPASDYIEISYPPSIKRGSGGVSDEVQIKIYNNLGECVLKPSPALPEGEGVRIDVSSLPAGVYFVKVGEKLNKVVKI